MFAEITGYIKSKKSDSKPYYKYLESDLYMFKT